MLFFPKVPLIQNQFKVALAQNSKTSLKPNFMTHILLLSSPSFVFHFPCYTVPLPFLCRVIQVTSASFCLNQLFQSCCFVFLSYSSLIILFLFRLVPLLLVLVLFSLSSFLSYLHFTLLFHQCPTLSLVPFVSTEDFF